MTSLSLSVVTIVVCLIPASLQQLDPVQNFCRRFGHQTTVIDSKLYIDGGMTNWNPLPTYPQNYSNTWLLYQDLEQDSSTGVPQLYANLSKNASIPDVSGGILWGDDVNKRFYLFGGEFYDTPPTPFKLYSYDVLNNWWDDFGPPGQSGINPVSFGAGVSVSETGTGFYYGGWLSNNSIPGWTGPSVATTGLVIYDMDQDDWTNNTGPDSVRRAEGSMNYIPASDGGMLVYFGGLTDPYQNETVEGQEMDTIFLYDVLSGKWYTQKTSGATPQMRRRFCSGVTWADDQSSYNIYLYGGEGFPPNTSGYDDVYILTIPTFTWIKLYAAEQYPHNSLTCNVINRSQMLIIGGTFPLQDTCDAPTQWGTHNLVLGEQSKPDANPWELFSTNTSSYLVPDVILSVVGGQATGGATNTVPSGGFDNPDLNVLMTKKASVPVRTPTRAIPGATNSSSSDSHLKTGAIAGIAVGCAVALIAILVGLCVFIRRHRRNRATAAADGRDPGPKPDAGGARGNAAYAHGQVGSPWSPHSGHSGYSGVEANTPSSYGGGGPPSPFARRPSHNNYFQHAPVELAAGGVGATGAEYEMAGDEGAGGGMGIRPPRLSTRSSGPPGYDQPKFDDQGRPWFPHVSTVQVSPVHGPGGVVDGGWKDASHRSGYSLVTPGATPLEMSAEPRISDWGWPGGGTGSSWDTGTGTGTDADAGTGTGSPSEDRRHNTFYHA